MFFIARAKFALSTVVTSCLAGSWTTGEDSGLGGAEEIEHHAREFLKSPDVVAFTLQNENDNTLIHLFVERTENTTELANYL